MITTRVPIAVKPGIRLLLEVDGVAGELPPLTIAFLQRIDAVREALAGGAVTPDDAHAMLLDCRWIGKLSAGGVARGMRTLCRARARAVERAA